MFSENQTQLEPFEINLRLRSRRRWLVTLVYAAFAVTLVVGTARESFSKEKTADLIVCTLIYLGGFITLSYPLKQFSGTPIPHGGAIRDKRVLLSLDDWAIYKYGKPLDKLAQKYRDKLLEFYDPDKYVSIHHSVFNLELTPEDARERDQASHTVLQILVMLLLIVGGSAVFWIEGFQTMIVGLLVVATTGPRAVVLWTKPDIDNGVLG